MLPNWATLSYLVAIALFIIGIKQLTLPATASRGNPVTGLGMLVAIGVTLGLVHAGWQYVIPAAAAGAVVGAVVSKRVAIAAMPQMVALFNGMGAGAAALVALGDWHHITAGGQSVGTIELGDHPAELPHRLHQFQRQHHRLRQAAGADAGKPHHLAAPARHQRAVAGGARRHRCRHRRDRGMGSSPHRLPRRRPAARPRLGASRRRRRHAGDHLPAELTHRPRGGGDRIRHQQLRAGGRRCLGRGLGLDPHPADEPGHGPVAGQRPLRRLRQGDRGRRSGGAGERQDHPSHQRRGRGGAPLLRPAGDHRPRLRHGCRPRPARGQGAGRPAGEAGASASSTPSTRSRAGCPGT